MLRRLLLPILFAVILSPILSPCPAGRAAESGPSPDKQSVDPQALIQSAHWKRARAILEPQVKIHPQDARSCYLLAEVKMSFKDFDGALPLAQRAVDLDGKNSDYHLKLGQVFGEMAAQASVLSAGPLALKFRRQVEIALQLDPSNLDALDSMMQFKFQAPAVMGGDKDQARALAEKITHLNASEGYLSRAELAEFENNAAEVERDYLKAVEVNPRNYTALAALARFYSEAPHEKLDEAAKRAQAALQIDSTRVEAHWILARIFAHEQRWQELDRTLAMAAKDVPDDLRPFYEAAQASLETGKEFSRAEGYTRKYLSQEPEGGEPDPAEAHRLLGLLFARQGRTADARSELQAALRIRPDFKAAKDDLKKWND